jgi:hypothetical protein
MRIALDFADSSRVGRVPRHGWARNSQGVKLLWLPVLRLVHEAHNIRKSKGLPKELSRGQWSEIKAFDQTVRHFALSLRELAKCVRVGSDPSTDQEDNEKFNTSLETSSLIPLYVDLAFVYARRLADHFARASRNVLFEFSGSAPMEYKKLRPVVADQVKLQRLVPICDADVLRQAFERHSGWLDKLRKSKDESGESQNGIRDMMEHHPIAVTVHHSQVGDGPWEVIANLGEPGINTSFRSELIPTLKVIVTDMASLWTMVCDSVGLQAAGQLWVAPYGDAVLLSGNDDDSTAFWPESQA